MKSVHGSIVRSRPLTRSGVRCARCGQEMAENIRAINQGVTPMCKDCRETDHGLANLWRRKAQPNG